MSHQHADVAAADLNRLRTLVGAGVSLFDPAAPTVWLDQLRRTEPQRLEQLLARAGSMPAWLSRHIPYILTIAATSALDRGQPQEALARTQAPIQLFRRGKAADDAFGATAAYGVAAVALAALGEHAEMQAMHRCASEASARAATFGEPYQSMCAAVSALTACGARLACGQFADAIIALDALPAGVPEIIARDAERYLAIAHCHQQPFAQANDALRAVLTADRDADDRVGMALVLAVLAELSYAAGDLRETLALCHEVLPLLRQLGHQRAEAKSLALLASVYAQQGRWSGVTAHTDAAVALFRASGDRRDEAMTALQAAVARQALGEHALATTSYLNALALSRELGHADLEHQALCGLGASATQAGDCDAGVWYLLQSEQLAQRFGLQRERVAALIDLAAATTARGRPISAQELAVWPVDVGDTTALAASEGVLRRAMALAISTGAHSAHDRAQLALSKLLRASGQAGQAFDLLQQLYSQQELLWRDAAAAESRRYEAQLQSSESRRQADIAHAQAATLQAEAQARQQLEVQLRAATHAAQAGSLAKSEFLAVLSHEIRTPLHAILGFADLLRTQTDPEEIATGLQAIERNGQVLLALFDDLLQFSQLEHGKLAITPQPVAVLSAAREAVQAHLPAARRKGLTLNLHVAPPIEAHFGATLDPQAAMLRTDPLRLRQVLGNLLGNAVKFTDAGSVQLAVQFAVNDGVPTVFFVVDDTGPGIADDQLQRIFDPFTQVDNTLARRHGGAGLGLAIVKRLTLQLGGQVHVRSLVGSGSTFTVALPLADPLSPMTGQTVTPEGLAVHKPGDAWPLRILLVDDDPVQRTMGKLVLHKLGYAPELVTDGDTALQRLRDQVFDRVLLDLHMPGTSGLAVAQQLLGHRQPRPHIIGLTAQKVPEVGEPLPAGIDQWMEKPMTADRLIPHLRTAYLALQQAPSVAHREPI